MSNASNAPARARLDERAAEILEHLRDVYDPLVAYHADCPDGIAALAVCAWAFDDALEALPSQYGDPRRVDRFRGRHVLAVDFSWKRDELEAITDVAASVTILDHHKSAEAELEGAARGSVRILFDRERSGAGLAWDTLFPGRPRPAIVDYVEDRDLWRWRLPFSRQINAALSSYPLSYDAWRSLVRMSDANAHSLRVEGEAIVRYSARLVETACARPRIVKIAGYSVPAIDLGVPQLTSDCGQRLAYGQSFGVVVKHLPDGRCVYSLRSDEHGVDVAAIAVTYGGGGHEHAAGFTLEEGVEP